MMQYVFVKFDEYIKNNFIIKVGDSCLELIWRSNVGKKRLKRENQNTPNEIWNGSEWIAEQEEQ